MDRQMSRTVEAVHPEIVAPAYTYPTVRRSGLNVLLTGLTTIAATLAGAASGEYPIHPGVFFPGFIVSIAVFLAFKRRLTIGRVQLWQERLIRAAMLLEASLILLIWIVVRDITARNFWALVL